MGPLRCRDCYTKLITTIYGRCQDCHQDVLDSFGELYVVAESLGGVGPEKYEYADPYSVYAYFYRCEPTDSVYLVKIDERQWCLQLEYKQGYPCAPRLKFVNAYNHADDNPIWWPKTKFKIDPVRQLFDIPEVDTKTAMYLPVENSTPLHRWSPNHYVELIAPAILP